MLNALDALDSGLDDRTSGASGNAALLAQINAVRTHAQAVRSSL